MQNSRRTEGRSTGAEHARGALWRALPPMDALLRSVLLSAAGIAACGPGSGSEDAAVVDANRADGAVDSPEGGSADPDAMIECPHRFTTQFPAAAEFCVGGPRGDAGMTDASLDGVAPSGDAAVDPATCALDCIEVCRRAPAAPVMTFQPNECMRLSATEVQCTQLVPCGRATEGVRWGDRDLAGCETPSLARWLDDAVFLEVVSVRSFERLADELAAHGAPPSLVERARASALDEQRHTEAMRGLAGALGVSVRAEPCVDPVASRTLEAIATENAVEGCVRETYGALQALHQAAHAEHPAARAVLAEVARDECAHAGLAWDVARWSLTLLDEGARERLAAAHTRAWDELERAVAAGATGAGPADALLGLPPIEHAARLARELRTALAA